MSLGDKIVAGYETTVDDEYQTLVLHQSNTIGFHIAYYGYIALGAALGWLLPYERRWASMIVIVPMLVSAIIGTKWLRRRIPRPRVLAPKPVELALMIFLAAVWLAGFQFNNPEHDLATALGMVVGGIVGGVGGGAIAMWLQRRGRRKDVERLDAEFADD